MNATQRMGQAAIDRFFALRKHLLGNDYNGYSRINRYLTLAWLAILGYPLYYWMWAVVFPQPYESVALRAAGVALALPLLTARRFHRRNWFNIYFYVAFTYAFPFFFTFMFLMNHGSAVWAQSLIVALFLVLYLDLAIALLSVVVGVACACAGFMIATGGHQWPWMDILTNVPILLFAVTAISIMKIGRGILADEKLHGMASALAVISHELRTPLRSVDASARGLKRYLPALLDSYERHRQPDEADPLPSARLAMMTATLDRLQTDVLYMNSAIDLLLANALQVEGKMLEVASLRIADVVSQAIARYPFESEAQRARVGFRCEADFEFSGNQNMAIMVIFNLLKNALRAVARAGKGDIEIVSKTAAAGHMLTFRDTGCGIPAKEMPHIFRRFYSYPPNASTGIGLAFCRENLAGWGASITCASEEGSYTEFVIQFRPVERN